MRRLSFSGTDARFGRVAALLALLIQIALGGVSPGAMMDRAQPDGPGLAIHFCHAGQAEDSERQPHRHSPCVVCPFCAAHAQALTLLPPALPPLPQPARVTGLALRHQARAPPALRAANFYPTGPPSPI